MGSNPTAGRFAPFDVKNGGGERYRARQQKDGATITGKACDLQRRNSCRTITRPKQRKQARDMPDLPVLAVRRRIRYEYQHQNAESTTKKASMNQRMEAIRDALKVDVSGIMNDLTVEERLDLQDRIEAYTYTITDLIERADFQEEMMRMREGRRITRIALNHLIRAVDGKKAA